MKKKEEKNKGCENAYVNKYCTLKIKMHDKIENSKL